MDASCHICEALRMLGGHMVWNIKQPANQIPLDKGLNL
jgi:hypothetical protein